MILQKRNTERTNLYRELIKKPELIRFLEGKESIAQLFDFKLKMTEERRLFYKGLYEGVGNTPIYQIQLINGNSLNIKLESNNQMGNNHYSRYWIPYLFLTEGLGIIEPNKTKIIEVTSGSSGISMSLACEKLGYDLTMIIPDSLPKGRFQPMLYAGTKLVKVNGYVDECVIELQSQLKDSDFFAANHSEEKSNLITYIFSRIAYEYLKTNGSPDVAILGMGNGTSTEAVAKTLKAKKSNTKIYAYHPSFDSKQTVLGLLAPNITPKHMKPALALVDELLYTSDTEIEQLKAKFKDDRIVSNLGISSLYAIKFAAILSESTKGLTFFSIGYDNINRYSND